MSFFDKTRKSRLVRPAEKQENISRFAGIYLDRLSIVANPSPEQKLTTLLARSPASPVARAVIACADEIRGLDVHIEVAFCQAEPSELIAEWLELCQLPDPVATVRWARCPALLDAHEQLVLGTSLSWYGDSMRRDPETRDAFETFDTFGAEGARRAATTFRALWTRTEPLLTRRALPAVGLPTRLPGEGVSLATTAEGELSSVGATVSTRH